MSNNRLKSRSFPNHYTSNSIKKTDEYAEQVFRAIINATSSYRKSLNSKVLIERAYSQGKQDLGKYLEELNIDSENMWANVSFQPTPILSKFEKIVVDDYQQLEEEPKAIATAYYIQDRKERRKSDLRFGMEFKQDLQNLESIVGFPIEDTQNIPEDEDELDLITSLQPDEREELLMNELLDFVLDENDYDSIKRQILSDTFQVNFFGIHVYTDPRGKIKIDFVPAEDSLTDFSKEEMFGKDADYAGKKTTMSIVDIRDKYNITPEQEHKLHKLAYMYRDSNGNSNYSSFSSVFMNDWRTASSRPYDDFSIDVYHVWYKTLKMVGYREGVDSYGKTIFDLDSKIEREDQLSNPNKRTGVSYISTSYEGWFAGNEEDAIVLEWGESFNQVRKGDHQEQVVCPYIYCMPDNRGTMLVDSAVGRVIPDINLMDLAMLKIKMTIAQHAPSGYAIDVDALMNIDLGHGGEMRPLEIADIYQQTGRLYYKGTRDDNNNSKIPIQAMNTDLLNPINGYLVIYNTALNNIRDNLGVNPNREGTADLNRVSNSLAQTQIAISQTATYYIYRSYVKATEELLSQIGQRVWNTLKYGNIDKGYLAYLGKQNLDFIKSREDITKTTYKYKLSLQMSQEDKARLDSAINACLTAGTLEMPDALLIWNIKDIDIAEKMLSHLFKKRKAQLVKEAQDNAQLQANATAEAGRAVEQEKQNTMQLKAGIDIQIANIREEGEKERALANVVSEIIKTNVNTGQPIPDMYMPLVQAYIESHTMRQERQQADAEMALAEEVQSLEQQAYVEQLQSAVNSGEITEQEAQEYLQGMGV